MHTCPAAQVSTTGAAAAAADAVATPATSAAAATGAAAADAADAAVLSRKMRACPQRVLLGAWNLTGLPYCWNWRVAHQPLRAHFSVVLTVRF